MNSQFLKNGFKNKNYYNKLKKFKYIFTSPKKAAKFISELDDQKKLNMWWYSNRNISFRKFLRNNLIYNENNRVEKIYKTLNYELKNEQT